MTPDPQTTPTSSEPTLAPSHTAAPTGTTIGGNVTTSGGDVVGGDKVIHQYGYTADDVARLLETVQRSASTTTPVADAVVRTRKPFEPETVLIPAGSFWMGRDDGPADQRPRHLVTLPTYAISRQPVTNAQYAAFAQVAPEHRPPGGGWRFTTPPPAQLDAPVTEVSWHSALAYCAWLTAQSGQCYRLPTEAEWEQAVQRGLIGGDVREWTSTIWGDDAGAATFPYPYRADGRDNLAATGVYRIWRRAIHHAAGSGRGFASPTARLHDLGLRVVLVATA